MAWLAFVASDCLAFALFFFVRALWSGMVFLLGLPAYSARGGLFRCGHFCLVNWDWGCSDSLGRGLL